MQAAIIGLGLGAVVVAVLSFMEQSGARFLLSGILVAASPPAWLTAIRLREYAPRVYSVRNRELWNVPLGVVVGVIAFLSWQPFLNLYSAVPDLVWPDVEVAGGVYVEAIQISFMTMGAYLLGAILFVIMGLTQLCVWFVPAYLIATRVMKPVEAAVERNYREKVLHSRQKVVGRRPRVTRLRRGGQLAETKLQLRAYGTMLSLYSGLAGMTVVAWLFPLH